MFPVDLPLVLIPHKVEKSLIHQRAIDGYVNATAMCKATGKKISHYLVLAGTKAFINELSRSTGITADLLIFTTMNGQNELRGTWVHPQVAMNLGQWASPKFAVIVSTWVLEWMRGEGATNYRFPYHIRRYLINRSKIPPTHFSMLDQMTIKLLGALESKGYIIPSKMMPDISLGRMFSKWLRNKGYDPDRFPTYEHVFDDGKRRPVQARLYPNKLMTDFNLRIEEWIKNGSALKYFSSRDQESIGCNRSYPKFKLNILIISINYKIGVIK